MYSIWFKVTRRIHTKEELFTILLLKVRESSTSSRSMLWRPEILHYMVAIEAILRMLPVSLLQIKKLLSCGPVVCGSMDQKSKRKGRRALSIFWYPLLVLWSLVSEIFLSSFTLKIDKRLFVLFQRTWHTFRAKITLQKQHCLPSQQSQALKLLDNKLQTLSNQQTNAALRTLNILLNSNL